MLKSRTLAALAVALTAAATAASAASDPENDAMAITNAKVSLAQAVKTAEQHAHGRASRAEYENTRNGWAYDVEVVDGPKAFDVKVDAEDDTVLASTQGSVDHDDEGDEID